MRILEAFDVEFTFPLQNREFETFTIEKDNGERFDVKIIKHPKVIESFRWLSANDCLRHLRTVEPRYVDNFEDVAKIQEYNAQITEHAYLMSSANRGNYLGTSTNPWNQQLSVPGLQPVPALEFSVTWTLYSRELAVMFKLACG